MKLIELAEKWKREATELQKESKILRKTMKNKTDAEEKCLIRVETLQKCATELLKEISHK